MTKKKSKPKGKPKEAEKPAPQPRQARLPGTEDAVIAEIEGLAEQWAEQNDELSKVKEERDLTLNKLLAVMHANHRTRYKRDGVEVVVKPEDEKVKVKFKKVEPVGTAVDMSA